MSRKVAYLLAAVAFVAGLAVSQVGRDALQAQEPKGATEAKAPKWSHGLALKARKGDEDNFTKDTKKFGVDVFVDENNGNLIYISETGSISVVKR